MNATSQEDHRPRSLPRPAPDPLDTAPAPDSIRLLLIDDETDLRESLGRRLGRKGYTVDAYASGIEALEAARTQDYQLALVDVRMPAMDGIEVLKKLKEVRPHIEVIILTGHGTVETAIQAIKLGAYDYLQKPFEPGKLDIVLQKAHEKWKISTYALELEERIVHLNWELKDRYGTKNIVGRSRGLQEVFHRIEAVGRNTSTVLVVGESGTGKELVARAIHYGGSLASKPFIPVNCAALPRELIESELFGYKRGSFTGAVSDYEGLFKAAEGGTIFLDEITEMAPETQAKLLRVIQEKCVRPVGSTREVPVNARIVAASNRDPQEAMQDGTLRKDLFYRLSAGTIRIPPLRERPDDIPLLVRFFIEKYNQSSTRKIEGIDRMALESLVLYTWPGNVRELENVIEGAFTFGTSNQITRMDLPAHVRENRSEGSSENFPFPDVIPIREAERLLIIRALEKFKGNKARAARAIGISRKQFYVKLKLFGLEET